MIRRLLTGLVSVSVGVVVALATAAVLGAFTSQAVVVDGLTAPRGLTPTDDGGLLIAEVGLAEDDIREAQRIPGRLVRWRDGEMTVVEEGLVSPSSVAITDGRIFVSEEFAGRVTEIPIGSSGSNAAAWLWALVAGAAAAVLAHFAARALVRTGSGPPA